MTIKTSKKYRFKKQSFREGDIKIWLDWDEVPRLMAILIFHKYCPYPSIATEKFMNGLSQTRCYVPSMYKRNAANKRKREDSLGAVSRKKLKNKWGVFPDREAAYKYFLLALIKSYFKWSEVSNNRKDMRNPRYISLTNYGKIKQRDFINKLETLSLEQLDSFSNYPLFVLKKAFMLRQKEIGRDEI